MKSEARWNRIKSEARGKTERERGADRKRAQTVRHRVAEFIYSLTKAMLIEEYDLVTRRTAFLLPQPFLVLPRMAVEFVPFFWRICYISYIVTNAYWCS